MKKRILALGLSLIMVLSLVACTGSDDSTPSGNSTSGLGVDEIVIGYVGPITGPYAGLGLPIHEIAKYTIDEINAEGGILGVPVRYVSRDDTGDPTKSATYVKELVEKEGIKLLLGPANSTCVAASLDYLTENKIVTLLASASAANLVDPVEYPYVFRTQVNNDTMAEGLVKNAIKGGYERVVLLGDNGTLGSDGIASMEKYAKEYGLDFASTVQFAPGTVDMTPVAQNIASANPDVVAAFATGADAAKIVAALDRVGMTGKYTYLGYMGTALANFGELAGEEPTQHVLYQGLKSGSVKEGDENPNLGYSQPWYDRMYTDFGDYKIDGSGRTWGWIEAGRAYDCLMLMKHAIEKTNSLDADKIKEALESVTNFESVLYESGYTFTATDHEGFSADELASCYMGRYLYDVGSLKGEPVTVRNPIFD
ncbi:ABC transporter substrate-binding protein [Tissierella sp.]|uniref:ABC transporter substrate-binding protein n=1 Tax=Tissierella sp. TaxID=41274 RepID=UPI002863C6FA|nr:ABC transporter substrate-binding protein [Tissierella sp.]MDR7855330.1 ABC transporter substrate-binding protein [Tissierella sp.]